MHPCLHPHPPQMMKLGSLTLGLCITSLQDFGALFNVWPYKGRDQAIVSNGKQIFILNVSTKSFPSTLKVLHLKKVFHVLRLTTNLINVSKFCTDNDTFFEFRPKFFLVKDQVTKKALLQGVVTLRVIRVGCVVLVFWIMAVMVSLLAMDVEAMV